MQVCKIKKKDQNHTRLLVYSGSQVDLLLSSNLGIEHSFKYLSEYSTVPEVLQCSGIRGSSCGQTKALV